MTAALSMVVTSVLPAMAAPDAGGGDARSLADITPVMELEFEGNTNDSAKSERQVSVKNGQTDSQLRLKKTRIMLMLMV